MTGYRKSVYFMHPPEPRLDEAMIEFHHREAVEHRSGHFDSALNSERKKCFKHMSGTPCGVEDTRPSQPSLEHMAGNKSLRPR